LTREIRPHRAGAVTNTGQLVSQLRLIEHFFDVAQAIRPVPEIPARDGSLLLRAGISRTIKESTARRRASLTLPLLLTFTFGKLILLALTWARILALLRLPGLTLTRLLTLSLLALPRLLAWLGSLRLALLLSALTLIRLLRLVLCRLILVLLPLAFLVLLRLSLLLIRFGKLLLGVVALGLTTLPALALSTSPGLW